MFTSNSLEVLAKRVLAELRPREVHVALDYLDLLLLTDQDYWRTRGHYISRAARGDSSLRLFLVLDHMTSVVRLAADQSLESRDRARSELLEIRAEIDSATSDRRLWRVPKSIRAISASRPLDAEAVTQMHELVLGRPARPSEIIDMRMRWHNGGLTANELMNCLFDEFRKGLLAPKVADNWAFNIMGSNEAVTSEQWNVRCRDAGILNQSPPTDLRLSESSLDVMANDPVEEGGPVYVSVIASLYRGGRYISRFLQSMVRQTIFSRTQLIIVDASSDEGESVVIETYRERFRNIDYVRLPWRAGIYEAWNIGVKMARGKYITNANLDDCRNRRSLEIQAASLDLYPFVDVVYQDFYYTLDPFLEFEDIAKVGFCSRLPHMTAEVALKINPPHHAPMWRADLHATVGYFDETYRSAGDYDFWLRCLINGKTFMKINEVHVAYYQNEEGLSTRQDGSAVREAREIQRRFAERLISTEVVMTDAHFETALQKLLPSDADRYMRNTDEARDRWVDRVMANLP